MLTIKSTYTSKGWDKLRLVGLDNSKGFLVHLPSRVDSLDGNLVKSCYLDLDDVRGFVCGGYSTLNNTDGDMSTFVSS